MSSFRPPGVVNEPRIADARIETSERCGIFVDRDILPTGDLADQVGFSLPPDARRKKEIDEEQFAGEARHILAFRRKLGFEFLLEILVFGGVRAVNKGRLELTQITRTPNIALRP